MKRRKKVEPSPPSFFCTTHNLQMLNTEQVKEHLQTWDAIRSGPVTYGTGPRAGEVMSFRPDELRECVLEDFDRWFAAESARRRAAEPDWEDRYGWWKVGP
jgi:hypothetical protein